MSTIAAIMRTSKRVLGVEMQNGGTPTVTRQVTAELGADFASLSAGDQARRVAERLKGAGWTARKATLVLPRSRVLVRDFAVPAGSPAELEQMIRFQLERELGLPLEDVRSAYTTATQPDGQIAVSAAAVRKDDLTRERNLLAGAGVEVDSVVVSTWGLAARAEPLLAGRLEPSIIAYMDPDYGEIVLVERGRPVAVRSLEDLPREAFRQEIVRTVPALEAQRKSPEATDLLLSGEDPGLGKAVEEAFQPSRRLLVRSLDAVDGVVSPGTKLAPALAPVVGACVHALRKDAPAGPDLLAEPVKASKWRKHRVKILAGGAALVFLLAVGAVQYYLSTLRTELDRVNNEIKSKEPQVKRLQELKHRARVVDEWTTARVSWAQVVVAVTRAEKAVGGESDKKLFVKSLTLNCGRTSRDPSTVRIAGQVKDEPFAFDFMRGLEETAALQNVKPPAIQKVERRTDFAYNFTIDAEIDAEQCRRPEGAKAP